MKGRRWIREQVVKLYEEGETSFRELEKRTGISRSTLQRWVNGGEARDEVERVNGRVRKEVSGQDEAHTVPRKSEEEQSESEAAAEIARLKSELHKSELHVELLDAMIEIAKQELGVDIRKKHGSRR